MLEAGADVRVVDRERGRVTEPLREQELLVGEDGVLADAIDVERSLQVPARDERDRDERLRVDGGPGDEADAWVEVRLVREHRLSMLGGPARDALAEREALAHHLVGPLRPGEHGDQLAGRLVGLVDLDVLVGDELCQRVRDALEQRVEALLGQDVVEDLRQPAIRLRGAGRDETDVWPRLRLDGSRVGHAASVLIGRRRDPLDTTSAKIRARWRPVTPAVRCSRV